MSLQILYHGQYTPIVQLNFLYESSQQNIQKNFHVVHCCIYRVSHCSMSNTLVQLPITFYPVSVPSLLLFQFAWYAPETARLLSMGWTWVHGVGETLT